MESSFAQPVPRVCALATVSYYKFKKGKNSYWKQISKLEFLAGDLKVLPVPKIP